MPATNGYTVQSHDCRVFVITFFMKELSAIFAGFSIVSCFMLCGVYLFSLPGMKKSAIGKITCTGLLLTLALVQISHLLHFLREIELLEQRWYAVLLASVPVNFYFFSRELLFHGEQPSIKDLAHGVVVVIALVAPLPWAVVLSFVAGCGYTALIFFKVLKLRVKIPRFQFERFFFALFLAMNVAALLLGVLAPWLNASVFYHGYSVSISIAMVLVTTALLVFPELLSDVLLASETVYAKSKLGNVDVTQVKNRLQQLMVAERCFENENLTLADVAEQLGVSSQQLSELVNSCFNLSFPRYVRHHRVEAAKQMLIAEPQASVLSVGMATGFKSQSSFYTAFKEHTGYTPAGFRRDI